MEFKTNRTRNISIKLGNKFNKNSVNNFSALPNLKFTKKFCINSKFIFKSKKKEKNKERIKSSRSNKNRSKSKKNKIKNISKNKIYEASIKIKHIKPNTLNINKKITFKQEFMKKIKNFEIIRNIRHKRKRLAKSDIINNNIPELACKASFNQNEIKKQKVRTIYLHNNKIKKILNNINNVNNVKQKKYIKHKYHPKQINFSLDSILSHRKINKTISYSFDKNDKKLINKSPRIKFNLVDIKLLYEKNKNNSKYSGDKKHQMKINGKVQNKNSKSKDKNKYNINRIKSELNSKIRILNNHIRNNLYNNSNYYYNYYNNKKKKKRKFINIISIESKKRNLNDNNFNVFKYTKENEKSEKINGVKINNYRVNKPKEENLKFTTITKDESDLNESQASKIIIGKIDGYKDIIETDKRNNNNKYYSNKIFKKNNNLYLYNNNYLKNNLKKIGNHTNNIDNSSKIDSISFNKEEFNKNLIIDKIISNYYNRLQMEEKVINNIDDISFSINTDNKNDNKKTNYKKIHINRKEDSKNNKTSDNCYIY